MKITINNMGDKVEFDIDPEQIPEIVAQEMIISPQGVPIPLTNITNTADGNLYADALPLTHSGPKQKATISKEPQIVESTLSERGESYGDAWKLAGQFLADQVRKYDIDLAALLASGYMYSWMSILSKLLRALVSPTKRDHWLDIAGYATLVAEDLNQVKSDGTEQ